MALFQFVLLPDAGDDTGSQLANDVYRFTIAHEDFSRISVTATLVRLGQLKIDHREFTGCALGVLCQFLV